MHPILVTVGPCTLYSYGVLLVIAFVVSTWLASRAARRLPPAQRAIGAEQLVDCASLALLSGVVGARLFYIILQRELFLQSPWEVLAVWHGGLVWYGGLAGGLLAAWGYVRWKRLSFLGVLDQFAPFLAVGHAIGRVGCFLNGCCYGKPTGAWWGVTFPGHAQPVIPTQLLEAAGLIVLSVALRRIQRGRLTERRGALFGVYLMGYAVLRFVLEFLRGDQASGWAGLTLPQFMSVGVWLVGLFLVVRRPSER
ncbi:MAG: prolipoprotein diacylglyceryl transferase [Candidatus Omnitrophota bacterium]|nr:prolipoprotein diacylglyceryl transferase [Candidatus Omnitrophota bacterium]